MTTTSRPQLTTHSFRALVDNLVCRAARELSPSSMGSQLIGLSVDVSIFSEIVEKHALPANKLMGSRHVCLSVPLTAELWETLMPRAGMLYGEDPSKYRVRDFVNLEINAKRVTAQYASLLGFWHVYELPADDFAYFLDKYTSILIERSA